MFISPFLENDIEKLPAIQPHDWVDQRPMLQFYMSTDFCHSFKVEIEGQMVGTGTAILHEKDGWLATIFTDPNRRSQGIGKAITQYLVDYLKSHHCEHIYLVATALGEVVYKKIGFESELLYDVYTNIHQKNLAISPNIKPFKSKYKNEIIEIDGRISGENRTKHLEYFLEDSFVYLENKTVLGAYFPSFGDGLIIAKSEQAGVELMKKRFQDFEMVSFPQANKSAANFMQSLGYEPLLTLTRMYLGKPLIWQPQNLYNRVGGNIG